MVELLSCDKMWLDPHRYEMLDDEMAAVLRGKSPDEKLAMAESMWRMARDLLVPRQHNVR